MRWNTTITRGVERGFSAERTRAPVSYTHLPDAYVGEGEPWTPLKLYYDRAFNPERTLALHEHLLDTHGELSLIHI